MATTVDQTFEVAYSQTPMDADTAKLRIQTTTALNGTASGSDITLETGPVTEVEMSQYHPGLFSYTTTGGVLTRGQTYRAFYSIEVGGSEAETHTQDFTAFGDAFDSLLARSPYTLTLADMQGYVSRVLGESDLSNPGTSTLIDIVNDAIQRVWDAHPWSFRTSDPWQMSLVSGQYRYRLPIDCVDIDQIVWRDNLTAKVQRKPIDTIVRLRENTSTGATNLLYWDAVYDSTPDDPMTEGRHILEVWPTPTGFRDRALEVRYQRRPMKVCKAADVIPLPHGYHTLVKECVRYLAAAEVGMNEQAAYWKAEYLDALRERKEADNRYGPTDLGRVGCRPTAFDVDEDPWSPYLHIDPNARWDPSA
ncbi:MAG: hypothetical protein ACIAQU_04360 [Phycisphaerales bacterium JB064]